MKIIFWENIISQHKVPYWNFLAKSDKVSKFTLVVEQELNEELKKQGWEDDFVESSKSILIVNPSLSKILEILKKDQKDSFHIFSGIRAIPMVFSAFKLSLNLPIRRILLTETVNLNGARGFTRRLYSFSNERRFLKYYDLVLGSGLSTQKWYLENGLQPEKFYPFLYSVQYTKEKAVQKLAAESVDMQFVFIGQLIERKGLDILLKSLSSMSKLSWHLDVYGKGIKEDEYVNLVKEYKLDSKITFKGTVNNSSLIESLSKYDLLLLPSRFDGWGAVINEAIASVVKVICSNKCGASILIVNEKIGHVFDIRKPESLTKILEKCIAEQNLIDRSYIKAYSEYLKGEVVARYLIDIIDFHYNKEGSRPLAPWAKFLSDQKNDVDTIKLKIKNDEKN